MKYQYVAYTEDKKIKRGTIDAASTRAAEVALIKEGFQRVLDLQDKHSRHKHRRAISLGSSPVKNSDILEFSGELAILLHSGIPIVKALELIEGQTGKPAMKTVIATIVSDLRGGMSFSQAIREHPRVFSTTYCTVIKAAEQSGEFDKGLQHMTDYLEKQEDAKKRIKRALMYPILVVILAIGVSVLLTTVVLPPMLGMFQSLGADLPIATKVLVAITSFVLDYKLYVLAAIVALPVIIIAYTRAPSNKYKIDKLMLRIPLIGQVILRTNLLYFCRTLAMLLEAGVQISDVLTTCISTVNNGRIREAFSEGEKTLLKGQPFSQAMAATKMFPASSIEALVVAEQTGELETTLKNIAGYFEKTNSEKMDYMISIIEPALTIAIGLVVCLIAISIIAPMYSITGALN